MPDRTAVFIDRDGTLIEQVHYLSKISQVRLLKRSAEAVRLANRAGLIVVVITNQSAVSRGLLSEAQLQEVNDHISRLLEAEGARLDAVYYCPHHIEGTVEPFNRNCGCRKPSPGMLLEASKDLGIDLESSLMVGDRFLDIEAGRRAGCWTALVRTGYGAGELSSNPEVEPGPDLVAEDLFEAVSWFTEKSAAG